MFDVSEFHLVPSTKCLMVMTQGSHPVWSLDISFKCFKINLSGKKYAAINEEGIAKMTQL
jgi:hypothetical protein